MLEIQFYSTIGKERESNQNSKELHEHQSSLATRFVSKVIISLPLHLNFAISKF